jgi:type II secretory ATPase GspE/PulE/Tfp pilus assembly ATPase PilB-like protein
VINVDPYLIAPTLVLAMAQRLSSMICPESGKDIPLEGSLQIMVEKQFSDLPEAYRKDIVIPKTVKEILPSADCPTGTRGRIAVFEMFAMDKDIEHVILTNGSELDLNKLIRNKGTLTMKEDAMLKSFAGVIPFEEVNKL